jgi:integrase
MGNGLTDRNPVAGLKAEEIFEPVIETSFAAITEPGALADLLRAIDNYSGQPATRIAMQMLARVFTRPGELRLARWQEFTLGGDTPQWVIPAERMKMRNRESSEHIVPLATQVVSLLRELEQHRVDDLVFPSLRKGRPISENTINMALRNMGYNTQTQHCAHGFRSTASTLLHQNAFDHDVIETQLAHKRPGVSGIYNRSHLLEQRRDLMQSWADCLDELKSLR